MPPRSPNESDSPSAGLADLVAPHLRKLSPYVPGRAIAEIEREFDLQSVIKLASNENPLGMSPGLAKHTRRP